MKAFLKTLYVPVLLSLALLCGCQQEGGEGIRSDEATVTIDLGPMHASGPASRALTDAEEAGIKSIDLLAFTWDGSKYVFGYYSPSLFFRADNTNYTAKATVQIMPGVNQKFVLVANARTQVQALTTGTEMEAALATLIFINANAWSSQSGNYDYIPMYMRYATPLQINLPNTNYPISGKLIRMLARVDINLKASVTNFQLKEAFVFNRKDRGYIPYNSENSAYWNSADEKALKPYMPSGTNTTLKHTTPYAAVGGKFEREIYTFEATGQAAADYRDATAIVIGGYFDYPTNTTKVTYYRIDIPKVIGGVPDPDQMGDILRNHMYEMRIKQIDNEGASTPEMAFYGRVKVEAEILDWNLADIEAKFDMTHWIKVNKAAYHIKPNGQNREDATTMQTLTISSNYDEGWYAQVYPASATSWINFFKDDGVTPLAFPITETGNHQSPLFNTKTIKFTVTPGNDWAHATIKIRCGGPNGKLGKYVDIYRSDFTVGDIFDWSVSDFGDINGGSLATDMYRLGVSRSNYPITRDQHTNVQLVISTDYSGGYAATVEGASWLHITNNASNSTPGTTVLEFTADFNHTFAPRSGIIRVKAGNIEKIVHVYQSDQGVTGEGLYIFPWEEPTFDDGGSTIFGGPYKLTVNRLYCKYDKDPKSGISIDVTADGRGDADKASWTAATEDAWIHLTVATGTAPNGGATTALKFNVDGTSVDRTGKIIVTLGTDRKKITKEIIVQQYKETGITIGTIQPSYVKSSTTKAESHPIQVFSSHDGTAWVAEVNNAGQVFLLQSVGSGKTVGEDLVFSFLPTASGSYTLTFKSTTNEFDPITKTITVAP